MKEMVFSVKACLFPNIRIKEAIEWFWDGVRTTMWKMSKMIRKKTLMETAEKVPGKSAQKEDYTEK